MTARRPCPIPLAPTLALALSVACFGPDTASESEAPAGPPSVSVDTPNLVVITLDTLRADRLGAYGYERALTDTLDGMAAGGRLYTRAYSPLPLTIPSHATLFSGRNPPTLGIRSNGGGVLADEVPTMAESFQAAGWATGASVAAFVTTEVWGFSQGFDDYYDDIPTDESNYWHGERPADAVIDDALGWHAMQSGHDRPEFLWVHLYDAHFPYAPPEGYLERAEGRPYDGEIAFVDDQVDRLVEAYDDEPTVFVVVGDHGEALGQHKELTHGMFAYSATQHVPFLVFGPGVEPEVVEEPVGLADVMPTILDLFGLPAPEGMEGRVVPGEPPAPVYMESYQIAQRFQLAPHVAVVDGPLKLIDTPRPELYDLVADPREERDLSADRPEDVARLREVLAGLEYAPPSGDGAAASAPMDPAVQAQLEALGYVEGRGAVDADADLPDPKDHLDLVRKVQRAERKVMMEEREEAADLFRELIADYPDVVEFRSRLAAMLGRQGRIDEARAELDAALERDPGNANLRSMLAGFVAQAGDFDAASAMYRDLAEEMPYTPRIRALAVLATKQTGERRQALELGLDYLDQYPDDVQLAGVVGALLVEGGALDKGLEYLEQGITADTPEFDVAYLLGARAVGQGQDAQAMTLFEQEVEHHPHNLKAWLGLARLHQRAEDWAAQVEAAREVLQRNPADTTARHLEVLGLFNQGEYGAARTAVDAGLAVDPAHPDLMLMDANLLVKEGRPDEGKARFAEAQEALATRQELQRAALEELGVLGPSGEPGSAPEEDATLGMEPDDLSSWGDLPTE